MIEVGYRYRKLDYYISNTKQKKIIVMDLEELRQKIVELYERNSYCYIEFIKVKNEKS